MLRTIALLSTVALALIPTAPAALPTMPPLAVLALQTEETVEVYWTVTPGAADVSYRVFGLHGGKEVPLGESPGSGSGFPAPRGYKAYGVASVYAGDQSPIRWSDGCIRIQPHDDPPVKLASDCSTDRR